MKRTLLLLAAMSLCLLGTARIVHASWSDWGFASYDECMGATGGDWADCNDGSQANPADPPGVPLCQDGYVMDALGNCVATAASNPPAPDPVSCSVKPAVGFDPAAGFDPVKGISGTVTGTATISCSPDSCCKTISVTAMLVRDGLDMGSVNVVRFGASDAATVLPATHLCGFTADEHEWWTLATGAATDNNGADVTVAASASAPIPILGLVDAHGLLTGSNGCA